MYAHLNCKKWLTCPLLPQSISNSARYDCNKEKILILYFSPLATTVANRDIDTAAKFIGAGAATVGVAGSGAGKYSMLNCLYTRMTIIGIRDQRIVSHKEFRSLFQDDCIRIKLIPASRYV